MEDGGGPGPLDDASTVGLSIFEIATARWLHVEEIISLLAPATTPLSLSTSPPADPPPSGTLLLYDRTVTRKYKADGHAYVKKRNSTKVREDHVKLRYQGAYRVAGSYVHSATTATMHRRAYRLLDLPGMPPGPTQNWVLLHYLDTMEAAQVSALFADHLAAAASKSRAGGGAGVGAGVPAAVHQKDGDEGASPAETPPLFFRPAHQFGAPAPIRDQLGSNHWSSASPAAAHADAPVAGEGGAASPRPPPPSPDWPEYAKHVAASAQKVAGTNKYAALPPQAQIAKPTVAIEAGLRPATSTAPMKHPSVAGQLAEAAVGKDLRRQQEVAAAAEAARRSGTEAAAIAAAAGGDGEARKSGAQSSQHFHHQRESSLDDGTMDVLWNMVMEEGADDVDDQLQEAAASAIQQHMTPVLESELVNTVEDAIQDVATAALEEHVSFVSDNDIMLAVEQVMTEGQLGGDIEDKVVGTLEDRLTAQMEKKLVETMEKELKDGDGGAKKNGSDAVNHHDHDGMSSELYLYEEEAQANLSSSVFASKLPQTPLPEVIDFTPNEFYTNSSKPMPLVVSTSAPIPILPPDDLPYRWHLLACFVDMSTSAVFTEPSKAASPAVAITPETDPTIMKVAMAPLRKLTPFSYKCEAPNDISYPGSRCVIIVGVRYVESHDPVWDAIRLAVKVCIQAEWQVASDLNEAQASVGAALVRPTFYAPAGGGNVQLLSQLSQDLFTFHHDRSLPAHRVVITKDLSVQEPPSTAGGEESHRDTKSVAKSVSSMNDAGTDLPAPAPAMATVASALTSLPVNPPNKALAVKPALSRKRTLSVGDGQNELAAANEVAEDWIGKQDPNADQSKTLGETVDRHCKIRFVERLANAVVVTGEEEKPAKNKKAEPVNTDDEESGESDDGGAGPGGNILLDASQMQDIDDEALDSLLDSVLIRFVESLVDTCASESEIKEQINTAGYAGFNLLHYAALYNMKSLIPLLLKRGGDPNLPTSKGKLTALHLASGAGHDQIVDLLVRNGADADPRDSFGLTPADHALRNGFVEIAKWLYEKMPRAQDAAAAGTKTGLPRTPSQEDLSNVVGPSFAQEHDDHDELMQCAFRDLPLKDKLGLNLFVQKYRRQAKRAEAEERGSNNKSMGDSSDEEEDAGGQRMEWPPGDSGEDGFMLDRGSGYADEDSQDSTFKFISEKDRESLKVAMSMMSKEELEELERNAPYSDVRNWMLRSNYESLKEASIQLEKQAKRQNLSKAGLGVSASGLQGTQGMGPHGPSNAKLSQALAMLVLRKNLLSASAVGGLSTMDAKGAHGQKSHDNEMR